MSGLFSPKARGGERASIILNPNSNDYVILVDQPIDGDNFCGNGGHSGVYSLRNKSRPVESASPILFSKRFTLLRDAGQGVHRFRACLEIGIDPAIHSRKSMSEDAETGTNVTGKARFFGITFAKEA